MAGNSELEIKLAVSDMRLFDIILSDPQILELSQGNVAETRNFEALYYDTASFALQRQGISYRVRREGQEWVATLKSDRSSGGGLVNREEWNEAVKGPDTAQLAFAGTHAGDRLSQAIGQEKLQVLFTTSFVRTTLMLQTSGGSLVELALDRGTIWGGIGGTPICELELELKQGKVSQLLELAAWIAARWHLSPENLSKYARGLQLLQTGQLSTEQPAMPEPAAFSAPPLLTTLADRCIGELFVLQTAFREQGAAPEMVRALRIQCRRLRSLLQFFQPRLQKETWQIQLDRLRQWGAMLGAIRDLDVINKAWQTFTGKFGPVVSASPLWRHILTERRDFLAEDVLHRLSRGELTQMIFDLQAWLYREQEAQDGAEESSAFDGFIRKTLLQATKQLREDIEAVDTASGMKKLHKLRIKVKRVRYFQEALAPIPHYRDEQFLAALKRVQTAIGKIHDAYQIKSLLDQVDAGGVDEKFVLEKELFLCWRGRQVTEQMFLLAKAREELRKATKTRSRTLASLRSGKGGKSRHYPDPHEPTE